MTEPEQPDAPVTLDRGDAIELAESVGALGAWLRQALLVGRTRHGSFPTVDTVSKASVIGSVRACPSGRSGLHPSVTGHVNRGFTRPDSHMRPRNPRLPRCTNGGLVW